MTRILAAAFIIALAAFAVAVYQHRDNPPIGNGLEYRR